MCRFITAHVLQALKKAESHPPAQAVLLHLLWQKLLWTFVYLARAVMLWWGIIVHICCWSRCPLWESQTHLSCPAWIQTNVRTVCFFCPEGTFFFHQQVSVIYTKILDSTDSLLPCLWHSDELRDTKQKHFYMPVWMLTAGSFITQIHIITRSIHSLLTKSPTEGSTLSDILSRVNMWSCTMTFSITHFLQIILCNHTYGAFSHNSGPITSLCRWSCDTAQQKLHKSLQLISLL